MDKRLSDRFSPEAVIINLVGIKGISTIHKRQLTRAPEKCCRDTVVGYTQCITTHNGSNPLIGERQGWVTHIAHKPKLATYEHHVEDNVHVYLLRPDDLVTHTTVALGELHVDGMKRPIPGLWQIIAFHRPGVLGDIYLQHLLMPFAPMGTPPISRLQ